ncbi:MAG: ribonuclease HII [Lentisphaerae bacterium]|jgi:ribonuclease HII|nr:ribonuclease HII [Lentisphaerota bacterium]MBT4819615.1 ribonuclease HII [Lentisphaerota bacterium]MBT5607283.1 ribonuclease HII [Lentisphaerota bacterium]MBT7058788.1 ribonuclease HII [Lentisphaerota bacterium]MBT7842402.1 ribonuclease HII [Lentisphaerota bacterium]
MAVTVAGLPDLFVFEREAREKGHVRIAGVDEVGRGPLAGPVVVAAVILPADGLSLPVNDSKALSAKQRKVLADALHELPGITISLALVSPADIDRVNILNATHSAMREAVQTLVPPADFALIDGLPVPSFPLPNKALVKGDARSASIAAASIIAKVYRDRLMVDLDGKFPGYGFAQHKGYGTAKHIEALNKLGPCDIHRKTFAPVRRLIQPPPEQMEFGFPPGTPNSLVSPDQPGQ